MANQISSQTDQTLSLLTSALNIHLNLGQSLIMNTSSLYMSFETIDTQSLPNKLIKQIENAEIQLPSNLQFNSITNSSTLRARSIVHRIQHNIIKYLIYILLTLQIHCLYQFISKSNR